MLLLNVMFIKFVRVSTNEKLQNVKIHTYACGNYFANRNYVDLYKRMFQRLTGSSPAVYSTVYFGPYDYYYPYWSVYFNISTGYYYYRDGVT